MPCCCFITDHNVIRKVGEGNMYVSSHFNLHSNPLHEQHGLFSTWVNWGWQYLATCPKSNILLRDSEEPSHSKLWVLGLFPIVIMKSETLEWNWVNFPDWWMSCAWINHRLRSFLWRVLLTSHLLLLTFEYMAHIFLPNKVTQLVRVKQSPKLFFLLQFKRE